MSQILQQFKGQSVRIVEVDGEPHFVLTDICAALGVKQPSRVAQRLDADEKGVTSIHTPGGLQQMLTVNESGLYAVILRSDKPVAKEFRKWVTNEVLPSLRKTGSYAMPQVAPDFAQLERLAGLTAQAIENSEKRVLAEVEQRIEEMVAEQPINSVQKNELYRAVRNLAAVMGGKPRDYAKAWAALKDRFQVAAYGDLQSCRFEDAMRFVRELTSAYETPRALEFGA